MKILFLELSNTTMYPEVCSDYQLDMLFHGLVKSGHEIYTLHDHWWMYESEKQQRPEDFNKIWGRGFTIYGTISDEEKALIHRVGLLNLADSDYDYVVVGLHHTVVSQHDSILRVLDFVSETVGIPTQKIAVIDGWDRPELNREIAGKTTYFKRELYPEYEDCAIPISFAFPEERMYVPPSFGSDGYYAGLFKCMDIAPLVPVNQSIDPSYMSTYIYDNEEDYYKMYRESEFAFTSKKGGWDTLRHYEIVANGCIPLFVDIEKCPPKTLHLWPKKLLTEIKEAKLVPYEKIDGSLSYDYNMENCSMVKIPVRRVFSDPIDLMEGQARNRKLCYFKNCLTDWFKQYGTTKYLAEYVLENVENR